MLETVIFSIDKAHDLHTQAKFLRYLDTLRAMGGLRGYVASCVGSYNGDIERSYMMPLVDFNNHVRDSGYVDNQESFLRVPGDVRQPCVLEYQDRQVEVLGPMYQVSKDKAQEYDAWTYVEATGHYFVC